ncbi:RNA polymerase subunit sigma-70 [Tyzzerella sp. An114]|uniref:RNA polymerase sigma factor n=1 Tax=Tyzzerella sp. An114 TaxID=1965545 RepID=UPI000B5808E7|nr:RNA polymerase sigma factor [Tyzzerella sp. An114]OUQ56469.1 RNA polymerase subunit sigma-70 [Tyzzerella sp. An114]
MSNRQLLEKFITENLDNAYRFAYSYTKNSQAAEDVVSESVIKALSAIDTLKNKEFLKTWFYRIIINTAISRIRSEQKIIYIDSKDTDIYEKTFDDYSHITLNEFIEKLDEKYKIVIILRYFEDMTLEEISKVTGENLSTVKSRLYRGLKILKTEMEED